MGNRENLSGGWFVWVVGVVFGGKSVGERGDFSPIKERINGKKTW